MLACVRASAAADEAALEDAHRRLRAGLAGQPPAQERLLNAQRAWLRYRDAHLAARFPAANPRLEYGSVYPLCAELVKRDFTRTRLLELERWPGACEASAGGRALAESLQSIRRDYADEPGFLARLETAQGAWEAFGRAEADAAGALRPGKNCRSGIETARAAALELWLRGVAEGDVCAGSVRVKAVAGGVREIPTLVINGARKKTVGTIRELVSGDRACYVALTDDNGEHFDEMAGFTLCDRERDLLGRRVRLEYRVASVLAAACQGNMDCGKSDTVVLIDSATVLPSAR